MTPVIIEKERLVLAGFSFFGDPFSASPGWHEENEIGRLWQRFMRAWHQDSRRIHSRGEFQGFEVHIVHPETETQGHYEVFVGAATDRWPEVPPEFCVKVLPPCRYAVFTLRGQQIVSDWTQAVYQEWLPAAGFHETFTYQFQFYDERFKGMDRIDESELDLYVPLRAR